MGFFSDEPFYATFPLLFSLVDYASIGKLEKIRHTLYVHIEVWIFIKEDNYSSWRPTHKRSVIRNKNETKISYFTLFEFW